MEWVVIGLIAIAALIFNLINVFADVASPGGTFWAVVATILLGISAVLMVLYRKKYYNSSDVSSHTNDHASHQHQDDATRKLR